MVKTMKTPVFACLRNLVFVVVFIRFCITSYIMTLGGNILEQTGSSDYLENVLQTPSEKAAFTTQKTNF